jgi:hypothetical protein
MEHWQKSSKWTLQVANMESTCKRWRKHAKCKTTKPKILLKGYKIGTKRVWIWVFNEYPMNLFPLGLGMVTCIWDYKSFDYEVEVSTNQLYEKLG